MINKIPCFNCDYKHECWKERYYCEELNEFLNVAEFNINDQNTIDIIDNVVTELEELDGYFDYECIRNPCVNHIKIKEHQVCNGYDNCKNICEKYLNFKNNNKQCYDNFDFYSKEV